MNILQAATAMDHAHIELDEILAAFDMLDGTMKCAYPWENQDEAAPMKCFAECFPIFLSTYRIICRDLHRVTNELKEACDSAYKSIRAEEKGVTNGAEE